MIHLTVGCYADGSRKTNGVKSENLAEHIQYNLIFRPGRALFVDGFCLHEGYLDKGRCAEIEAELKGKTADRDTAPYV